MFYRLRFTVRSSAVNRYRFLRGGLVACAQHADDLRAYARDLALESEGDIVRYREVAMTEGICPACKSQD